MRDFYEVLGVVREAGLGEIREAYRRLAQRLHPDKGGGAEEFQELQQAYAVLSNSEKRAAYDRGEYNEPSLDDHAWGMVKAGFMALVKTTRPEEVKHTALVDSLRRELGVSHKELGKQLKLLRKTSKHLRIVERRIKRKTAGKNVLQELCREERVRVVKEIVNARMGRKVVERALELCEELEYEVDIITEVVPDGYYVSAFDERWYKK